MIKNQKGFTYPLTLSILIVFLIFFSTRVEQLLLDRKIFHETKVILQQEYYLNVSVKKVEKFLQTENPLQASGTFQFQSGNLEYQVDFPSANSQKVTLTLHLDSGNSTVGYAFYDRKAKKMTKWVEIN